jgi:hypothetical protein
MKLIPLSILAILLCIGSALRAEDSTTTASPAFAGRGGHGNGELRQKLLEKFDTNHDGKLDETEMAAAKAFLKQKREELHKKLLEKFDANHDGKLEPDERAAAKAAMQQRRAAHGGAGRSAKANKTSSVPDATDSPSESEKEAVQKAIDQIHPQPPVRF